MCPAHHFRAGGGCVITPRAGADQKVVSHPACVLCVATSQPLPSVSRTSISGFGAVESDSSRDRGCLRAVTPPNERRARCREQPEAAAGRLRLTGSPCSACESAAAVPVLDAADISLSRLHPARPGVSTLPVARPSKKARHSDQDCPKLPHAYHHRNRSIRKRVPVSLRVSTSGEWTSRALEGPGTSRSSTLRTAANVGASLRRERPLLWLFTSRPLAARYEEGSLAPLKRDDAS